MRTLRRLPTLLVLACALPASAEAAGDADKGRQIAIDHCSRCHVVPDHNPYGGIESTPSFRLLARRDDYLVRFETFFDRPPHPVVVRVPGVEPRSDDPAFVATFVIQPEQVDDIVAYARKLHAAE